MLVQGVEKSSSFIFRKPENVLNLVLITLQRPEMIASEYLHNIAVSKSFAPHLYFIFEN